MSSQFELADPPSDLISTVTYGPEGSNRLLVSSWDKSVNLYDVQDGQGSLLRRVEHRAPVLDVCFGDNESVAYSAGLDGDVSQIDFETSDSASQTTVLSTHKDGVKAVAYARHHSLLISASWDCTLHLHLMSQGRLERAPATISLSAKPYCLSFTKTKLIVGMAAREIVVYDLDTLKSAASSVDASASHDQEHTVQVEPFQRRESSIKFMTRAIGGMPDQEGYAISSIEGRVGVEWLDPSEEAQAQKYAFKCHRQTEDEENVAVYPVNALAFHPVQTANFASGGGDGFVVLWDGQGKRRIRQYPAYPDSVSSMAWNTTGSQLAVGVGPGFTDGSEEVQSDKIRIFVRQVPEAEVKGRDAAGKQANRMH